MTDKTRGLRRQQKLARRARRREDRTARPAQHLPIPGAPERPDEASAPQDAAVEPPQAPPQLRLGPVTDEVKGRVIDALRDELAAEFPDLIRIGADGMPNFVETADIIAGDSRVYALSSVGPESLPQLEDRIAALNNHRDGLARHVLRIEELVKRLEELDLPLGIDPDDRALAVEHAHKRLDDKP